MKPVETIINRLRVAMTDARQNESHFESWMILNEAICDAIDALAEQPAQQQEPVEYWTVADGWVSEQAEVPAAAWIYPEFWDHCKMVGCGTAYRLPGAGRQPLYTSPLASKPWVGLTDKEVDECFSRDPRVATRNAEAKLREKNT